MKHNKSLVPAGQHQKNGLVKKIGVVLVALAVIGVIGSDPEEQGSVSTSALASVSSTDLSAFSAPVQRAIQIPVYDINTLVAYTASVVVRHDYL